MNRVKSPSVAAAEIWANARTCEVKFVAIVFTLKLTISSLRIHQRDSLRDLLPCPFNILDFSLYSQLSFCSDFSGDSCHFRSENGQLVNHIIDGVDQIENLS